MRPVHILLPVIVFFSACSGKNAKDGLPFTKDSLMGNWMLIRVNTSVKVVSGNSNALYDYRDSVMNPIFDNLEMTAFSFQPKGMITIDEGKVEKSTGNWVFTDRKELLMQYKYLVEKDKSRFTVQHYWNDSLELENAIGRNKDTLYVKYILIKLRTNDSVPDLFDPALNKWREKPLQAESEEAIRLRLKQVLYYYAAYFANISGNKIPYFNIQKILCPIIFYSGGIGLQKFNKSEEWKKLFYDIHDAEKAHALLSKAFSRITNYPDKGRDYVQEYIVALKMVADAL